MIVLLTKDTVWKVKCSTGTIPTLDILNCNYEKIIKGRISYFMCGNANELIWICSEFKTDIKNRFLFLADYL